MIKLKEIIEPVDKRKRSVDISGNSFDIAVSKGQFSNSYIKGQEGHGIYRGMDAYEGSVYKIATPSKIYRESANTNNFYTGLLDGLPSWKNYPKRSRSLICSNVPSHASVFGRLFLVYPKNGAKIGICPARDFWVSFPEVKKRLYDLYDMSAFNDFFTDLFFRMLGSRYSGKYLTEETYEEFMKNVNEKATLENTIETIMGYSRDRDDIIEDLEKNFHGDWEKYFDGLLDPNKNGFHLTNTENYDLTSEDSAHEVWTDSTSLMQRI